MDDIIKLEKLLREEIQKNIKIYGNHNIYLIDIKEICNNNDIDFKEICTLIGDSEYILSKYKELYYLLVTLQVYVLIRNENEELDNRFYDKFSEITGIDTKILQQKIIPKIQKNIWDNFYNDMKKQNIYVNEWKYRKGAYKFVMYPKSQVVYSIGQIKKILENLSKYHEYVKDEIKRFVEKDNKLEDMNDVECGTEQVYTYYKIHGIPEKREIKVNIKEKEEKEINRKIERIKLLYSEFDEIPRICIESEDDKEIDVNQLIDKVKEREIIFFKNINLFEYEYNKYFYEEDSEKYVAICPVRYIDLIKNNSIQINEKYFFVPSVSIELQNRVKRSSENDIVMSGKNKQIIVYGGLKVGINRWIQGHGPVIITDDEVYINGEKQPVDYLETCKSGKYIIRTKYDNINIEIVDEYISEEEFDGWEINKEKIIPSSKDYNIKGIDILMEDEINYAKNIFYTYSGLNMFNGENKWITKYWDM